MHAMILIWVGEKNSSTCHFCGYHESRRDEYSQMGGDVGFSDEEGESNGEGEKGMEWVKKQVRRKAREKIEHRGSE